MVGDTNRGRIIARGGQASSIAAAPHLSRWRSSNRSEGPAASAPSSNLRGSTKPLPQNATSSLNALAQPF